MICEHKHAAPCRPLVCGQLLPEPPPGQPWLCLTSSIKVPLTLARGTSCDTDAQKKVKKKKMKQQTPLVLRSWICGSYSQGADQTGSMGVKPLDSRVKDEDAPRSGVELSAEPMISLHLPPALEGNTSRPQTRKLDLSCEVTSWGSERWVWTQVCLAPLTELTKGFCDDCLYVSLLQWMRGPHYPSPCWENKDFFFFFFTNFFQSQSVTIRRESEPPSKKTLQHGWLEMQLRIQTQGESLLKALEFLKSQAASGGWFSYRVSGEQPTQAYAKMWLFESNNYTINLITLLGPDLK